MPAHIAIRLAWHDNGWNGQVCRDPAGNSYCVGAHSFLTERIAANKKIELESPGATLDGRVGYLPPCYWTSNAFSSEAISISHVPPLKDHADRTIHDRLSANSVLAWPWRLALNHGQGRQKTQGSYPPDLTRRIVGFIDQFKPGESIMFYYLNYSNPVSADDGEYALVGCSVLDTAPTMPEDFAFSAAELAEIRARPKMKNFPAMNQAIQFTARPESTVRLPYQEYLNYVQQHPGDDRLLDEIKVLVTEPGLIPAFKYAAETVGEDACIYLLYKLRQSLSVIQAHGIVLVDHEIEVIERLIKQCWLARGLYPGLGGAINLLAELGAERGCSDGDAISAAVSRHAIAGKKLIDEVFHLMTGQAPLPAHLSPYRKGVEAARLGVQNHPELISVLRKLSLFNFNKHQMERILLPSRQKLHPFGEREICPEDIAENPYLLCEEYIAEPLDPDEPDPQDRDIGLFTIDIGMFPDTRHVEPNSELQSLTESSPERLRALIIEFLAGLENSGHCFASLEDALNDLQEQPLFNRAQLKLDINRLRNERYTSHFSKRIDLVENDNGVYLYLREIRSAEHLIRNAVDTLITRPGYHVPTAGITGFLNKEAADLRVNVLSFDKAGFMAEKGRLIEGCLNNSLFVITGKPGSGKTTALGKVIEVLIASGESVTLLTPAGQASLMAGKATGYEQTQTIDKFINDNQLGDRLEALRRLEARARDKNKPDVQNLIIDDSSMIDLPKLAGIFGMLKLEGANAVKRVILVGDDNQLPPAGFGQPFYDLVEYLKSDKQRSHHLVRLETNCRPFFDPNVLRLVDAFSGRNRYSEVLAPLTWMKMKSKELSPGLQVSFWETRAELEEAIQACLGDVFETEGLSGTPGSKSFNELMGLDENGHVKGAKPRTLGLDRFQIITPCNAGFFGTLGLNDFMRLEYQQGFWPAGSEKLAHPGKIIRTNNWYRWDAVAKKNDLMISQGSLGMVCDDENGRNFYFPERKERIPSRLLDDEENFEPAYAITIQKSQGSEIKHTFVVIPHKKKLLFRELIYTALARSSHKVYLFVQQSEEPGGILGFASARSVILSRNSSLFQTPMHAKRMLEPEAGVLITSKAENIIYRALMGYRDTGQLAFEYEKPITPNSLIKTDFRVKVGNREYYWEHLGMLDIRDYFEHWKSRRQVYETEGLSDNLVTTDNMCGLASESVDRVIHDLLGGNPGGEQNQFSNHHYHLNQE
jgi:exodeoxyribonuclease V alpha subunit